MGPTSPGVTADPDPVITTVYRLILHALPRDARTRFADENAPAGDKRLRLTRQRVRQEARPSAILTTKRRPRDPKPKSPSSPKPRSSPD